MQPLLSLLAILAVVSLTKAQTDPFANMYGTYVVSAANLATCRTGPLCASFCCPLNVTIVRATNSLVEIDYYIDPTTYSRCGQTPTSTTGRVAIQVGISSQTSTNLYTTMATVFSGVQVSATFQTFAPQQLWLVQGATSQCQVQTGSKLSSTAASQALSAYLVFFLLAALAVPLLV
jgi:hypothetical protein